MNDRLHNIGFLLSISYGAGLRASEVTHLKISDIDKERKVIRVEHGKGGQDRHALFITLLVDGIACVVSLWAIAK